MKKLLSVLLAVIAWGAAPAVAADPIKIGLMAPLTGSWASEGQEMKRNVELLAAEQNAQKFYSRLAEQTKDGPLHRLYNELSIMEDGHVGFLQNMLTTSTAGGDKNVN